MYRGIVVLALLLASSAAGAQQVYKCVNGKQVSYQSEPCPGAAVKSWDARPEIVDAGIERRMAAIGLQQAPRNAPVQRYNGTPASSGHAAIASQRNADACEQAKAERKAAYDRVGLNRSFAFSSHWDGVVQQACR